MMLSPLTSASTRSTFWMSASLKSSEMRWPVKLDSRRTACAGGCGCGTAAARLGGAGGASGAGAGSTAAARLGGASGGGAGSASAAGGAGGGLGGGGGGGPAAGVGRVRVRGGAAARRDGVGEREARGPRRLGGLRAVQVHAQPRRHREYEIAHVVRRAREPDDEAPARAPHLDLDVAHGERGG